MGIRLEQLKMVGACVCLCIQCLFVCVFRVKNGIGPVKGSGRQMFLVLRPHKMSQVVF